MTDEPSTPLETDLDWVRRTLAPADPVRPGDRHSVAAPALIADSPRLSGPRRRSRPRLVTAVAAAAAALIVGVVAAVAGTSGGRSPHRAAGGGPGAVLAAYSTTMGAQSAQVRASLKIGGLSVRVAGVADLRSGQAVLTVVLPAPIGQVEVRSTGQEYFVRLPPQLQGAAGGKPWLRVDRGTLETLVGSQLGAPGVGATLDFGGVLAWLQGVSGQIATVAHESVNGTPTTHYRAEVSVSRVAASMGLDSDAASALTRAVGRAIPVNVWIDAQGRLRQLQVSLDLTARHAPQGVAPRAPVSGLAVLTVDLGDFGVAVRPVPPPASLVANASSLIGALAGAG
jgi:hypothetical protein